jgi:DNA-binding MarR family transcriptional regulator
MTSADEQHENQAIRLAVAISRLRTRLREAARAGLSELSISQLAILKRLRREGAATAASLAMAEHVSQQAIAQTLARLKKDGLVQAVADPSDRRKVLISMTDAGHRLVESILASRDAWLVRAIDASVTEDERVDLDKAIELLERLADVRLGPNVEIR